MTQSSEEIMFSKKLNVLIVEDNHVDLRITEAMLQDNDTIVDVLEIARTLEEALNSLSKFPIDVIILDLNLPDSQGVVTLQTITSQYGTTAVVVNTGAYEEELGIHALEYGAQDFLVKGRYNAYTLVKSLHYAFKRKELQLELKISNQKLKKAQDELVQAEKMKVVGGLASGVAHEVRNPLSTIVYGSTFLKQKLKTDDEDIQTVIESIDEAAHRASLIIKDLLDFASLGKLKTESCCPNEIFDHSVDLLNHEFKDHDLHIQKKYTECISPIMVDRARVEQVCINILLNAAVAMNKKGTLYLSTQEDYLREGHDLWNFLGKENFHIGDEIIVMSVSDEGSGIESKHLENIFDPFFTTRRARGGIGLGLAVCRNIMDLHKGAIFLRNNETKGASAYLVFHK